MSLDVYLSQKDAATTVVKGSGIFVRVDGETREISREEWDQQFPGREPVTFNAGDDEDSDEVYSANITHNLSVMAREAGIYECLWRPEEIGVTHARQLVQPLEEGLEKLKQDPVRFRSFNPENGWGNYEGLIRFVENYLNACKEYPDAEVSISR